MNDSINLERFVKAQQEYGTFQTALAEIRNGHKETYWMRYIFPQMIGLGSSSTSEYYAIRSLEEAKAFLNDPYLGGNLREISQALLELNDSNASSIFGWPDNLKLKSSMTLFVPTLFVVAAGEDSVFAKVLDKFFGGEYDAWTLNKLGR